MFGPECKCSGKCSGRNASVRASVSGRNASARASVSGRNASVRASVSGRNAPGILSAIARSLEGEHHPESVLATSMNGRLGDILSVTPQT